MPSTSTEQEASDFVTLDIGKLSTTTAADADSNAVSSPRVIKSVTRKGSPRADKAKAAVAKGDGEKHAVTVHVAYHEEPVSVCRVTSPTSAGGYRRVGSRRAPSTATATPWLHPRRVLLVFATLSSMGTLILLYFTLSMAKISSGTDADAR